MTEKIDVEALRVACECAVTEGCVYRSAKVWTRPGEVCVHSSTMRALLAAYEAHDAAVRERDEAKRELRKCTINKDELWKVVRDDADKLRQVTADGEDMAQMLVQRDKEADEQIAALTAERDALKSECIADPKDETDKPPLGAYDYAKQWARDTLSGRAAGGRFPWGQRNIAQAYLNLSAERDALKAERDMWEAEVTRIGEEWTKADDAHQRREAALATRDATIATLIEALGPFAKYANDWVTPRMYDSVRILDDNAAPVATVRAFRRARAALNSARSAHG